LILLAAIEWLPIENDTKQDFAGPLVSTRLDPVPSKRGSVRSAVLFCPYQSCPTYNCFVGAFSRRISYFKSLRNVVGTNQICDLLGRRIADPFPDLNFDRQQSLKTARRQQLLPVIWHWQKISTKNRRSAAA
jgi:hypothetical protein